MAKGRAKDAPKKKAGKKRGFWGKLFRFIGIVILIGFVLSILTTVAYKWINPPITPLMVIRKVQLGAPIEHEWRDLEDISPYMVQCAIASEDNNFLGHKGFDWGAIDRAIEERESGRRKRGASTISQQTAKNVFLWPKSSWVRKGFEVYYTFLIENIWGKERIMEIYLNEIEMGEGIYGAQAAAQHYFNKDAKNLTRREAALITACYPQPLKKSPVHPSKRVQKRANQLVKWSAMIGRVRFDKETIQKAQKRYEKKEAKRKAKKK